MHCMTKSTCVLCMLADSHAKPYPPTHTHTTHTHQHKQAGELLMVEDDSEEAKTLMSDVPIAYIAPRNVDPSLLRHAFGPTPR